MTRRSKLLFALFMVVAAAAGAFEARAAILGWVGARLVRTDDLVVADAILVLGGGDWDRETEAAALHRGGWAPIIALTSPPDPILEEMKRRRPGVETQIEQRVRYLTVLGVPRSAIVVLSADRVTTTIDEAVEARGWADHAGIKRLLVVTSSYHTARATRAFGYTFKGSGVDLRVRAAGLSVFKPDTWWQRGDTRREGFVELEKSLVYWARYW
jgi:uncharacterized SAM-binding protein YcdF (DUF218 family)